MDVITQIFSNFRVTWPKFIAQVILFLLVYWVLNKYAFGPVLKMLNERRRRIEEGQHNAEKIKKQLAEAELRYQEVLRKANEEATKLLDEARAAAMRSAKSSSSRRSRTPRESSPRLRTPLCKSAIRWCPKSKKEMVDLVVKTTAKVVGKVITPGGSEASLRGNRQTARSLRNDEDQQGSPTHGPRVVSA